ncbi:MAG: sulfatase-like hydrolase/transferase [Nibricoccus sp.]
MSVTEQTRGQSTAKKPNVLWVVTTQWRAQAVGYAGDPDARTPALDALAAESVNFTQAVTPHPFGPFARAALLTGVASPENGVKDYFDPLPLNARTIAHELRDRGYATAFFGKWHLGKRDPSAALVGEIHAKTLIAPEARGGFEFWEGFESGFLLNDPWLHGTRLPEPVTFAGYQSDVVCSRAAEWMHDAGAEKAVKRAGAKPWFCVVSLEAPHPPYDAPANGIAARGPGEIILSPNVPRGGDAETKARRELAGYYAHIEATDRAVGKLLGELKEDAAGGFDETLVVFTSVHGDMHGAHGMFRKGWPHEESVRVPLLVKLPVTREDRGVKSEKRADAVSLVDLRALTLGCADRGEWSVGVGAGVRTAAKISMPSVVALPHQCDRVWRGVRTAKRKLVLNTDGAPWLFFDLENDPLEMKNLAGERDWQDEIRALAACV